MYDRSQLEHFKIGANAPVITSKSIPTSKSLRAAYAPKPQVLAATVGHLAGAQASSIFIGIFFTIILLCTDM